MKKILKEWREYSIREEEELVPSTAEEEDETGIVAVPSQEDEIEIMRGVLKEVQDMAIRLMEMEEELKDKYKNGVIMYHPGRDFSIAAKKLADSGEWRSLASGLNRWIENEVSLPAKTEKLRGKYGS